MPEGFFPESAPMPPSSTRRTLVALAASAPLLAAAASLLSKQGSTAPVFPPVPATDTSTESAGYHETDHIRRYYRSTKYF